MKTRFTLVISMIFFLFFCVVSVVAAQCWQDPTGRYTVEKIPDVRPNGNHQLDCTLILPYKGSNPGVSYPVIGWANGWGWNENAGENEIDGYLPGLIDWAVDGQFIVIAANQWSARERDVLQCVAWLLEESNYPVDKDKVGLSGHSQGGGAVIRSADGNPKGRGIGLDLDISTVIAMNPYGPAWNEVNPEGPALIVGGFLDTTTPPGSYKKAWQQISTGEFGVINATLLDGDHNNNAWVNGGCDPEDSNFGEYQELTLEWWKIHFNGEPIKTFCDILKNGNWIAESTSLCLPLPLELNNCPRRRG